MELVCWRVDAHPFLLFCPAFSKAGEGTGRVALYSPFLFVNFFFAAFVTKKKWINGKQLLKLRALFIDIKIPITLFSLAV